MIIYFRLLKEPESSTSKVKLLNIDWPEIEKNDLILKVFFLLI
jgi:hypothetical protein